MLASPSAGGSPLGNRTLTAVSRIRAAGPTRRVAAAAGRPLPAPHLSGSGRPETLLEPYLLPRAFLGRGLYPAVSGLELLHVLRESP